MSWTLNFGQKVQKVRVSTGAIRVDGFIALDGALSKVSHLDTSLGVKLMLFRLTNTCVRLTSP